MFKKTNYLQIQFSRTTRTITSSSSKNPLGPTYGKSLAHYPKKVTISLEHPITHPGHYLLETQIQKMIIQELPYMSILDSLNYNFSYKKISLIIEISTSYHFSIIALCIFS